MTNYNNYQNYNNHLQGLSFLVQGFPLWVHEEIAGGLWFYEKLAIKTVKLKWIISQLKQPLKKRSNNNTTKNNLFTRM